MTIVEQFIARLKSGDACPFKLVQPIADLAAVKDRPAAIPAAYVLTMEEASDENPYETGSILQRLESDIGVILVAGNVSDATAGAASLDIERLKTWVRKRLIGWEPDTNTAEPVTHVAGKLLKVSGGTVWWGETFGIATFLSSGDDE